MKNFYQKFQLISKFPLFPSYLRWVYQKAVEDSSRFSITPFSLRSQPMCLLCGVAGEITANEYISFVLKTNPNANMIIIDLGKEQVESVKKLVKERYPKENIQVMQANAFNLGFIKNNSIDWIDTDGFFSFFDQNELQNLFKEWKRILKDDGFISFRELTSGSLFFTIANHLRAFFSKAYMEISLHLHSEKELQGDFRKIGFRSRSGWSPAIALKRYCLVKDT